MVVYYTLHWLATTIQVCVCVESPSFSHRWTHTLCLNSILRYLFPFYTSNPLHFIQDQNKRTHKQGPGHLLVQFLSTSLRYFTYLQCFHLVHFVLLPHYISYGIPLPLSFEKFPILCLSPTVVIIKFFVFEVKKHLTCIDIVCMGHCCFSMYIYISTYFFTNLNLVCKLMPNSVFLRIVLRTVHWDKLILMLMLSQSYAQFSLFY